MKRMKSSKRPGTGGESAAKEKEGTVERTVEGSRENSKLSHNKDNKSKERESLKDIKEIGEKSIRVVRRRGRTSNMGRYSRSPDPNVAPPLKPKTTDEMGVMLR